MITKDTFGYLKDGREVTAFTMTDPNGMTARFIDYGCILTELTVPDRDGNTVDVVLGYDDVASYEDDPAYLGALVGRYANRIKNSRFTLNGKEYLLEPNDGPNHLHGVLSRRLFKAEVSDEGLHFSYTSPDGEDGLPGEVRVNAFCSLDEDNVLTLRYEAVSDQDTIINLTNHSYFNLAGHDSGSVDDQLLMIAADSYLETSADCCPTGRALPAEGPMDFRNLRRIGDGFNEPCEQRDLVGGYDHCYILRGGDGPAAQPRCPEAYFAAQAYCPGTGILLIVYTTQPGLQFYSGNYLDQISSPGKSGVKYTHRSGFALETQHYPCSPDHPAFPSTVLKAGDTYLHTTSFKFQIKD